MNERHDVRREKGWSVTRTNKKILVAVAGMLILISEGS